MLHRLTPFLLLALLAAPAAVWWQTHDAAAIEPAAGPAKEASGHGGGKAESGVVRSHTGKILTSTPTLPHVSTGAQQVITSDMLFEQELLAATPEQLQTDASKHFLQTRLRFNPFSHNPAKGPDDALVTLIEMTDLSCVQCMDTLKKVDALLAAHPSKLRVVNIHTPVKQFNDVNMAAFYGKVAQRGGVFWEYRNALETLANPTPESYFDTLIAIGMDRLEARRLMQTEARRFYRELDADARLAGQLNVGNPPHVLVNGIHVGMNGLPLETLDDVVTYELNRPRQRELIP
ncbi:MAG: thioredoxin domain-containing protein [Pseudomonadaceae bacterium]|nr:thioredoxin domain-containing protein [Pseudomonadaceae bacterium]